MVPFASVRTTNPVFNENYCRTNEFISTQSTRAYDALQGVLEIVFPRASMDVKAYTTILKSTQAGVLNQFRIHELRVYKKKENPQHEYLIASVHKSSSVPPYCYLVFDRCIDDSREPKTPHLLHSSIPISDRYFVKDHVQAVVELPNKDELVQAVGFNHVRTKRHLPLSDMAVLASTVHDHAPYYHVLNSQCFWFAAMIIKVVKSAYGHTEDIETNKKKGTFHGIPLQKEDPDNYEEVQEKFEAELAKFNEDVLQLTQRERELTRKQEEQTKREQELFRKQEEQMKREQELIQKQEEQTKKEQEFIQEKREWEQKLQQMREETERNISKRTDTKAGR